MCGLPGRCDLRTTSVVFWRHVPRVALFMVVGQVGMLLPMGLVIMTGIVPLAMTLIAVWTLVWNTLSAAFLPARSRRRR